MASSTPPDLGILPSSARCTAPWLNADYSKVRSATPFLDMDDLRVPGSTTPSALVDALSVGCQKIRMDDFKEYLKKEWRSANQGHRQQAGFTSETIQQLFCNALPESLRMEDGQACRIGGSRIHPEFLYLVEPSMDFLDERGQPVSPIQAALAAGYRRNPRLFPIFNEIQATDGDLVTYDELRNCSRPIVDCTQPTNYMIGLFRSIYLGISMDPTRRMKEHLSGEMPANALLGALIKKAKEEDEPICIHGIIEWDGSTPVMMLLFWESVFIAATGSADPKAAHRTQHRIITLKENPGQRLPLRMIIACWLLYCEDAEKLMLAREAGEAVNVPPSRNYIRYQAWMEKTGRMTEPAEVSLETARTYFGGLFERFIEVSRYNGNRDEFLLQLFHITPSVMVINLLKPHFAPHHLSHHHVCGLRLPITRIDKVVREASRRAFVEWVADPETVIPSMFEMVEEGADDVDRSVTACSKPQHFDPELYLDWEESWDLASSLASRLVVSDTQASNISQLRYNALDSYFDTIDGRSGSSEVTFGGVTFGGMLDDAEADAIGGNTPMADIGSDQVEVFDDEQVEEENDDEVTPMSVPVPTSNDIDLAFEVVPGDIIPPSIASLRFEFAVYYIQHQRDRASISHLAKTTGRYDLITGSGGAFAGIIESGYGMFSGHDVMRASAEEILSHQVDDGIDIQAAIEYITKQQSFIMSETNAICNTGKQTRERLIRPQPAIILKTLNEKRLKTLNEMRLNAIGPTDFLETAITMDQFCHSINFSDSFPMINRIISPGLAPKYEWALTRRLYVCALRKRMEECIVIGATFGLDRFPDLCAYLQPPPSQTHPHPLLDCRIAPNVFMDISTISPRFIDIEETDMYLKQVLEDGMHLSRAGITAALHAPAANGVSSLHTVQGMIGWLLAKKYRHFAYPMVAREVMAHQSQRYQHPGSQAWERYNAAETKACTAKVRFNERGNQQARDAFKAQAVRVAKEITRTWMQIEGCDVETFLKWDAALRMQRTAANDMSEDRRGSDISIDPRQAFFVNIWHIRMGLRGYTTRASFKDPYSQKIFNAHFTRLAVFGGDRSIHASLCFHRDTDSHRKIVRVLNDVLSVPVHQLTKQNMFIMRMQVETRQPLLNAIMQRWTQLPRLERDEAFFDRQFFLPPLSRLFNDKAHWGPWEDWEEATVGIFWRIARGKWRNGVDYFLSYKLGRTLVAVRKHLCELESEGFFLA